MLKSEALLEEARLRAEQMLAEAQADAERLAASRCEEVEREVPVAGKLTSRRGRFCDGLAGEAQQMLLERSPGPHALS